MSTMTCPTFEAEADARLRDDVQRGDPPGDLDPLGGLTVEQHRRAVDFCLHAVSRRFSIHITRRILLRDYGLAAEMFIIGWIEEAREWLAKAIPHTRQEAIEASLAFWTRYLEEPGISAYEKAKVQRYIEQMLGIEPPAARRGAKRDDYVCPYDPDFADRSNYHALREDLEQLMREQAQAESRDENYAFETNDRADDDIASPWPASYTHTQDEESEHEESEDRFTDAALTANPDDALPPSLAAPRDASHADTASDPTRAPISPEPDAANARPGALLSTAPLSRGASRYARDRRIRDGD